MMFLILLFVKHWYVDFVLQTEDMVKSKGMYGTAFGIYHSLQHAAFTLPILLLVTNTWLALLLASLDGIIHYHIDWLKMNFGNRDIQNPKFWHHLGLDQMCHQVMYIVLAYLVVI